MITSNHYDFFSALFGNAKKPANLNLPQQDSSLFQVLFDCMEDDIPTQPLPQSIDRELPFDPSHSIAPADLLDRPKPPVLVSEENSPISAAPLSSLFMAMDPTYGYYDDDDDLFQTDKNAVCSVDEAFSTLWQQEDIRNLLNDRNSTARSPEELVDEVRPVMSKQELANAYHSTALLMTQRLPLLSMNHALFHRRGAAYDPIDTSDLYDLLCDITDKSVYGGIKKSGRKELYSSVASVRRIQISADDIARNPNLIPLIDKVYDVETNQCHDPRDDEYFFSRVNLTSSEIGTGDGRLLERFLETSFGNDSQIINRFLQTQGVILSPYTPKAIFHYFGPHDTGKSEAVRLVSLFLHPQSRYVHSIDDPNKLIERFALAPLQGKRLLLCPDASKIAFKEATCAVLKQLAGGRDLIGTEAKNRPHFTFVNEAKPLFLSNHPLRGDFDEAFLSRLVTVPFCNTIPPEKRIPNLAEMIFASRGYFFLIAMQALRKLIDDNFLFTPVDCPPSYLISEASDRGIASISDSIYEFVKRCCVLEEGAFTASQLLFEAYQRFCSESRLDAIPNKAVFARTLNSAFPEISSKRTASYHGFAGIRLRE